MWALEKGTKAIGHMTPDTIHPIPPIRAYEEPCIQGRFKMNVHLNEKKKAHQWEATTHSCISWQWQFC